jgi:hypothetical protein
VGAPRPGDVKERIFPRMTWERKNVDHDRRWALVREGAPALRMAHNESESNEANGSSVRLSSLDEIARAGDRQMLAAACRPRCFIDAHRDQVGGNGRSPSLVQPQSLQGNSSRFQVGRRSSAQRRSGSLAPLAWPALPHPLGVVLRVVERALVVAPHHQDPAAIGARLDVGLGVDRPPGRNSRSL